jgi:hypothetical protein
MKMNGKNMYIYGVIVLAIISLYILGNYVEGFQNVPPVSVGTPTVIPATSAEESESSESDMLPSITDKKPTAAQIRKKVAELSAKIKDLSALTAMYLN